MSVDSGDDTCMSWKEKETWKEQNKGVIKQMNKLQGFNSTQRGNKETGLNKTMKTYDCFVFPVYIRQVPELHFFCKSVCIHII